MPSIPPPAPLSRSTVSHYYHLLHNSPSLLHLRHLHAHLLRTLLFFSHPLFPSKLLLSYFSPNKLNRLPPLSHFLNNDNSTASYNAILSILSRSPSNHHHLLPFFISLHRSSLPLDHFTLPPLLRSPSITLPLSLSLHSLSLRLGLLHQPSLSSSLLLSYFRLGHPSLARQLFDEMPTRDTVLWTSVLSGYSQNRMGESALDFFRVMVMEKVPIDEVILVSLLLAVGQSGRVLIGRSVHGFSIRREFGLPLTLGNAVVDMYVKCGEFSYAERVFDQMSVSDVITWSCLILGYGLNGNVESSLQLFEEMRGAGVRPNSVSFLGVLSACGHAGLVDRALGFLGFMAGCGVRAELKHYACVVDAMGKAGMLVEAERFVKEMPAEADEAIFGALLAGCRMHGNIDVAERVFRRLMRMFPDKSGYYMSLANLYADAGRFADAEEVRMCMRERNVAKTIGSSSVELNNFSYVSIPS